MACLSCCLAESLKYGVTYTSLTDVGLLQQIWCHCLASHVPLSQCELQLEPSSRLQASRHMSRKPVRKQQWLPLSKRLLLHCSGLRHHLDNRHSRPSQGRSPDRRQTGAASVTFWCLSMTRRVCCIMLTSWWASICAKPQLHDGKLGCSCSGLCESAQSASKLMEVLVQNRQQAVLSLCFLRPV